MNKRLVLTTIVVSSLIGLAACEQDQAPAEPADPQSTWFEDGQQAVLDRAAMPINRQKAKNIIIFIGDGMGISTLTAARIHEGQLRGEMGEDNLLSFERFTNTALVKTYSTNAQVNDSAGTASAIFTGIKTNANMFGVSEKQTDTKCEGFGENKLKNIAEYAAERDMSIGVVTTTRITHATAAAVYAHSPNRNWSFDGRLPEDATEFGCTDIASQLVSFGGGRGLDVAMGGGRYNFLPDGVDVGRRTDGRNLVEEWVTARDNRSYLETIDDLNALTPNADTQVLGLFSRSHFPYILDREADTKIPMLTDMALKAVEVMEAKGKPYILLIEGGKIDLAHHRNWARKSLTEAVDLSATVRAVSEIVDLDDTLMLVTADHSHSLTINGSDSPPRGTDILGLSRKGADKLFLDEHGEAWTTLQYVTGRTRSNNDDTPITEENLQDKDYAYKGHVDLDEEKHTGEDVALFAAGPRAHVVRGVIEQNEIFHIMAYALGWLEPDEAPQKGSE